MINKRVNSPAEALAGIKNGATVMLSGFGSVGEPDELIETLHDSGVTDLTIVSNNAGSGDVGLARLISSGRVRKIICSYPRSRDPHCFDAAYRAADWSAYAALPAFAANNRGNAYRVFLEREGAHFTDGKKPGP